MNLAEMVEREIEVPAEEIMFLRHTNDSVASLRQFGATVEEYTCIQPIGSKYDFYNPKKARISVVVVIVDDRVYGLFRVVGVEAEGTNYTLSGDAYRAFDRHRNKPERPSRRFQMVPITSLCAGLRIRGWERRAIMPVQRHRDKFFNNIRLELPDDESLLDAISQVFEDRVTKSMEDSPEARRQRLAVADRHPHRMAVTTFAYARNPDVVAEVLFRAVGVCEGCGSNAPFNRRSDGSPYLEVHHKTPLSEEGEDTVENAIAVCPNCHRKAHYS